MQANDLRDQAARLRDVLPAPRSNTPPQENGTRIGTIDRSDTEQLRINWAEYEGKNYVSLRIWTRFDDGSWWPSRKGMSVRIRELPGVAEAIAEALTLATAEVTGLPVRPPMPGRNQPQHGVDYGNLPPANGQQADYERTFDEGAR